jgi:hypothetical protein
MGIQPFLESELATVQKKELKRSYLLLTAKICCFKGSEVSTYCPQIFGHFVEALNSKKNKSFRAELWDFAFKYIFHFNSCRKVSELDLTTTTIKYDVY